MDNNKKLVICPICNKGFSIHGDYGDNIICPNCHKLIIASYK